MFKYLGFLKVMQSNDLPRSASNLNVSFLWISLLPNQPPNYWVDCNKMEQVKNSSNKLLNVKITL